MALQTSGPISLSDIQAEFGGTNPISLSEYYRGGGLVPSGAPQNANIAASGAIAIGGFYGAVRAFVFNQTISTNTSNYNLRSAAIAAGWDTTTPLQASITINTGVFVSATNTGVYAFDTGESFPSGSTLSLVNNGLIVGMGGAGGAGAGGVGGFSALTAYVGTPGAPGGPALIARYPISITNSNTIAGGGGGGGGGQSVSYWYGDSKNPTYYTYGGGGGGAGRSGLTNSTGGAGGYGDNGSGASGRPGTSSGPGGGGTPGLVSAPQAGYGGNGGGWGAAGNSGGTKVNPNLFTLAGPYSGGAGGSAVAGNSNISWVATGTRLGTIA